MELSFVEARYRPYWLVILALKREERSWRKHMSKTSLLSLMCTSICEDILLPFVFFAVAVFAPGEPDVAPGRLYVAS